MLRVAKKTGDKAIAPSAESALDGSYPISRPLFLYTLGEPEGAVKDFIDWTLSPTGQRIVAEVGFVPKEKQHGA
jgi:phosphate transport system substrate-binding protein